MPDRDDFALAVLRGVLILAAVFGLARLADDHLPPPADAGQVAAR